jgi:maltose O-acetyltransferase
MSRSWVRRRAALVLYYGFAQYLPTQPSPGWQVAYWIRRTLVRAIFLKCGRGVIVKSRAYFGSGIQVSIGDRSQIGVHSRIDAGAVIWGSGVLMGLMSS